MITNFRVNNRKLVKERVRLRQRNEKRKKENKNCEELTENTTVDGAKAAVVRYVSSLVLPNAFDNDTRLSLSLSLSLRSVPSLPTYCLLVYERKGTIKQCHLNQKAIQLAFSSLSRLFIL